MYTGRRQSEHKGPIRYRTHIHNTIFDVFRNRGWTEVKKDDEDAVWDIFWADVSWIRENFDHFRMDEHQRINHFRNHYELTRKNLLIKNLKRLKKQVEREKGKDESLKFDFFPITFVLPGEYAMFVEEFKRSHGIPWIMKPIAKAQGKGIFLFTKLSQIQDWKTDSRWSSDAKNPDVETYIAQRYIPNPYLIGGKKFDLRIYAMVTSYSPLNIWLYRSGFARFSNTRFSMDSKDVDNNFIHLTNVAVQKTAEGYDKDKGCKWMLREIKMYLISKHGTEAVTKLFNEMESIIIKSCQSVQKIMINDKHCFEIYGYDLLIDDNIKAWLIEVNASPSLTADTISDYHLKTAMLSDAMNIIDMEKRRTGKETKMGGWDLIWKDGPVTNNTEEMIDLSNGNSRLGCYNDIKKVAKMASASHAQEKTKAPAVSSPESTEGPN